MLLGEGEAQPEVAVAVDRPTVGAKGRAAVPGVVEPSATTTHAVRPTRSTSRIRLRTAAITAIPVLTPLQYISSHVIYAKFIGRLGGNGM